jgi:hypothetical protein
MLALNEASDIVSKASSSVFHGEQICLKHLQTEYFNLH